MPISSTHSLESQLGNLKLAGVNQFVTDVQSLLKRRNPVKVSLFWGHKIETFWIKQPTYCSQCDKLINVFGFGCKSCKLVVHKACIPSISEAQSKCVKSHAISYSPPCNLHSDCPKGEQQVIANHKFESKYFCRPTFCHHCGTILLGLHKAQGVQCSQCQMSVHKDCAMLITIGCITFSERKSRRKSMISIDPSNIIPASVNAFLSWRRDDTRSNSLSRGPITIEDFELIGIIGRGSFGKVFEAHLKGHPNTTFALKAINKTNLSVNSDPECVLTEMKVLDLSRQYNFLTIAHYCFQTAERLYFIMEHVGGKSLLYHVENVRKFSEKRTRFHSAEIVLALQFLHRNGVIHRDIKLDNVIIDKEGHCKLIDYGLAKILKDGELKTRTFCGTSGYMSPEIIKEHSYSYAVDWWSLGILMFEMLIGYSPYNAGDDYELHRSIIEDEVKFPKKGFLSHTAESILKGFLTKDPNYRLGSNLMEDCEEAIRSHPFFMFELEDGTSRYQWLELESKQLKPPYIPAPHELVHIEGQKGLEEGPMKLTPISSGQLREISDVKYEGFSYISDSFKALTDQIN